MYWQTGGILWAVLAIVTATLSVISGSLWIAIPSLLYTVCVGVAFLKIADCHPVPGLPEPWLTWHLEQSPYTPLYRASMQRTLKQVLPWVGQATPTRHDRRSLGRLFADSLTWRLLDRALLLAVAYPILLRFVYWVVSGEFDGFSTVAIFWPDEDDHWRYLTLGYIALFYWYIGFLVFHCLMNLFGGIS